MPAKGLRLVVTGGIGSGKSTVSEMLRARGILVFDADLLAREALEPGGSAFDAVVRRWPDVVKNGEIDRAALARIVFSDPHELEILEGLVHPFVRRRIAELDEEAGSEPMAVEVSVPKVLNGLGWHVVVVDAPDEVRRRRLRARGMDPVDIDRRMAAQPPRAAWCELGDTVLTNEGDLDELRREVDELLRRLGVTGTDRRR